MFDLSRWPQAARWSVLVALSALFAGLLGLARIPAALLLGAMAAGILVEQGRGGLRLPAWPGACAQAVIGCLIARTMTPSILHTFAAQWPLFLGVVLTTVAASCSLGWALSRWRILPGTTAIWGLLPGAASAMMLMAEDFGADGRLVAFMQYTRVIAVALCASLVARLWVHTSGTVAAPAWWAPVDPHALVLTLLMIAGCIVVGHYSRLPVGGLIITLFVGSALSLAGWVTIVLPMPLLAVTYAVLGWGVGLRFTAEVLAAAARALPQTLLSIALMIGFGGVLAFALVELLGIDPLTAYLATSPGGADSVAIIAASTKVDVPFVMSLQIVRSLMVLFIGPTVSRFIAGRIEARLA